MPSAAGKKSRSMRIRSDLCLQGCADMVILLRARLNRVTEEEANLEHTHSKWRWEKRGSQRSTFLMRHLPVNGNETPWEAAQASNRKFSGILFWGCEWPEHVPCWWVRLSKKAERENTSGFWQGRKGCDPAYSTGGKLAFNMKEKEKHKREKIQTKM